MILKGYLIQTDAVYDPDLRMPGQTLAHPGYHTTLPNGAWVHSTAHSMEYAIALLRDGSAARVERAREIIGKVLSMQDCNPVSPTYGIWPWFAEESLKEMSPPDWNWADFMGVALAEVIKRHEQDVVELRDDILLALFHAAGSIYRRNIHPGYTNISILGAIVTSAIGEILGEERITDYGRRRLQQCVHHLETHGGFNEYNSPPYTMVVIRECERGLRLITDKDARGQVRLLLDAAWQTAAEHFHPATGQWAGPHSRSYSNFLSQGMADLLEEKTGLPFAAHPLEVSGHSAKTSLDDCHGPRYAQAVIERFRKLPQSSPFQIRRQFIRRETDETSTWGTTWFSPEACLGSVNREFLWDQRRAVLAYWNGAQGTPVALRVRFMRDDREFASVFIQNAQDGPKVLTAVNLLLDRGVFHPVWGAPKENLFDFEDLRLRYELTGQQVEAEECTDGSFLLSSGDWQADITPAPCCFDGSPVPWQITRGENFVSVDAVCYHGERKQFPFASLKTVILAAGLHLHKREEAVPNLPLQLEHDFEAGQFTIALGGLSLQVPDHAVPLPYSE